MIKLKELLLKSEIFSEKLREYKNLGIVKVIIEEPLLNSNNIYIIQTLLRFNSFIFKEVYNILGIIPELYQHTTLKILTRIVQENKVNMFCLVSSERHR